VTVAAPSRGLLLDDLVRATGRDRDELRAALEVEVALGRVERDALGVFRLADGFDPKLAAALLGMAGLAEAADVESVTDRGLSDSGQAPIRNGPEPEEQSRQPTVTDSAPVRYRTGPPPVTCAICGRELPPSDLFVVLRLRWQHGKRDPETRRYEWQVDPGDTICCDCANANPDLIPWVGYGVTGTRPDYTHTCGNCGRSFYGAKQRRWCSDACGEAIRQGRRAAGRYIAREARTSRPQACAVCGETFTPSRSDARFCSNACRQDAYRKRKLGASA
jgi:predicted nucleic acid-binding Zn ribbon protein